MGTLTIRKAQREGARSLIVLAGPSGSGKTRTALEIALGLSGYRPDKIGFIDTENRRGSLQSDVYKKDRENPSSVPFLIGDLFAPFSPDRYIEAIQEFQQAGVDVLIIDSGSHEWEGIGGCHDIAEAGNPKIPKWNLAKGKHKKFMNVLLTCDCHVILCLRAREKAIPEKKVIDGFEKTVFTDLGMQAITEKNVMFEATVSLMISDLGRSQKVEKCPEELLPFFGRGKGHITDKDGAGLRAWIAGAQQLDPEVERVRNNLISIADQGLEALKLAWSSTPARIQKALGVEFLNTCKASAAEYERQKVEAAQDGGAGALNAALSPAAATDGGSDAEDHDPIAEAGGSTVVAPEAPSETAATVTPTPEPDKKATPPARRKAGSNPPPPVGDKPEPPANPPPPSETAGKVNLF